MKKYFEILRKCNLFNGIKDDELTAITGCLDAKVYSYRKKEIIIKEGEKLKNIGIVLRGSVWLERTDYYGNRNIVTHIEPSELFGEAFACAEEENIPFYAVASDDCEIMFIDSQRIIHTCKNSCEFHNKLIFNLLKILAVKNISLNQKAEITAKRTTREKLMTYLFTQAKKTGKQSFTIPFDRQTLSDYLEVDRSGLSAEISKLRKEGIIESKKSYFKIL